MIVPSVIPGALAAGTVLSPRSPPTSKAPVPSDTAAATTTISPWASLLNRLQSLANTDPASLAAVAGQLAVTVHATAAQTTGDEKSALTKFGDALDQVAKTGNVSALEPVHHHHNHAAKQKNGGTGALLSNLLQQIDTVLGPNATPATTIET